MFFNAKKKITLDRKYIYTFWSEQNKGSTAKMKVFKTLACPVNLPAPFLNSGYLFYFIT